MSAKVNRSLSLATDEHQQQHQSVGDWRAVTPCRFFLTGSCTKGTWCPFLHDIKSSNNSDTDSQEQDEDKKDDFTRTIGGAFVQFDAGARVSKIRLPGDFSAARISGLRQNTSKESVRDMLAEKSLHVSVDDICTFHMEVSFNPAAHGEDRRLMVTPIAAPMPSGHNARRVDCKKVHVSWHKAVKIVWLNFGNGDIARRVSDMFSKGTYRVLDQRVTAAAATRAESVMPSRPARGNHVAWTVVLADVPAAAQERDILRAITHERNKPHHVEMGAPTYSTDEEEAWAMIRSLLTNIGPLEYCDPPLETNANSRRVKATARFLDEADARRASMELDKMELPFHRKARLTVQMVYSANFKVAINVFDAVQSRIVAQQTTWKDNISFRAYKPTGPLQRFRVLKIEGESAENVVSAKADLESILAGVIATDNDATLWHSSLKTNGKLFQAIKTLEKELSVTILRDKVKSELRLFGAQRRCEDAQRRLAQLIRMESRSNSSRAIELEPQKFFWACHGGFRTIAGQLGQEKVLFDIISTPKKIIVSGSLEDYDLAVAIMEGRKQVSERVEQPKAHDTAQECSVCWTEADAPVKMKCGHIYCLECFEDTCTKANTTAGEFMILCHGNQGNCRSVMAVEDLQTYLSSAALETVLELSFSSHVKRNPNTFRYCPSPDCDFVYRVSSAARTQNCSNCLRPTCSACHEPHIGMSCAEHQDLKSGGFAAFMKLKKKLGIKDCPKCATPLEKVSGCNHMTCAACKAHICWVCLMTFANGPAVYDHMGKLHGGHIDLPGG
ncbi:putative ariadne RING finger [Metarhizium anisopliae]|nr:putative ariadne RING finger [Metarhizium anisopliae]